MRTFITSLIRPRISMRLQMIVGLSLLSLAALATVMSFAQYDAMYTARVEKLKAAVDLATSVAANLEKRVQAGELTREQALSNFRDAVRPLRFDDGNGYYFIYTLEGTQIVFGPDPKSEGQNKIDKVDSYGNKYVQAQISAARAGAGVVTYWFPRPGMKEPLAKVAYVAGFPQWNISIGTAAYIDDLDADFYAELKWTALLVLVFVLVTAGGASFVATSIKRPLSRLQKTMIALADGHVATSVAGTNRYDELGEMARAVEVFRTHAIENRRLIAEQDAMRVAADSERRRLTEALAANLESQVGGVVKNVSLGAENAEGAAKSLSGSVEAIRARATSVSTAAQHASTNVNTVAAATEELSSSIFQVNELVARSTAVVGEASSFAKDVDGRMKNLVEVVSRIGDVASLINTIASQTNLLALNATIEAARAGAAGKGFEVVANEVKNLAAQTAKATDDIRAQIAEVQSTTGQAVFAINQITDVIHQIDELSKAVSSSLEQQRAATDEIARNAQQAATGTHEVSQAMQGVSEETHSTLQATNQTMNVARALSEQAHVLQTAMLVVLKELKASSEEESAVALRTTGR
ncbi:methyl-accepting chemotaxis protein [Azospirillum sp. A39]|uniref:methyl-accepting chemotaxis protein n=1 Tax=Azospirillum sp. A39 TaxID=3462279 RepID=UPI004046549D